MDDRSFNEINYKTLFELNTDAIILVDHHGKIIDGNMAVEKISGYSIEELKGNIFLDYLIKEHRELATSSFHSALEGELEEYRYHFVRKNGKHISTFIKFIPTNQMEQTMFIIIKDISLYDQLSDQYFESELNFQIITENVQDVIILLDHQKRYLYISPSSKDMFGFDPKKAENIDNLFINIHPDYTSLLKHKFNESILTKKPYKLTLKALHEERGWVWTEINGTPVFDKKNQFRHMVLVARDISLQKEREERLEFFAYHDSLTGLPNRRYFNKQLIQLMDRLNKKETPFSIILLDIDDFKLINDRWGHEVGDEVICEFAKRIEKVVGNQGVAARLGGDEFIILLDDVISVEYVKTFIRDIQQKMVDEMKLADHSILITTSIGATICMTKHMTESYYIKNADIALYKVKEKGKNQYHILYS